MFPKRRLALCIGSTGSIRKFLADDCMNFHPRAYFKVAPDAMKDTCKRRYEAFGSAGMAYRITPILLEKMVGRSGKGERDPKVN